MEKQILDPTCGGRLMWFDKYNPYTLYTDKRSLEKGTLYTRPNFSVNPDRIIDFRKMPFRDQSFNLIVFDPPHTIRSSELGGIIALHYGRLSLSNWQHDLARGFRECWRCLKKGGTLVFKWSECDKPISEIEPFYPVIPCFGTRLGKDNKTLWVLFYKHI